MAAGRAGADLLLGVGRALRGVGVAAAGATAVELDAGAGASDAVALARAAGGGRADGGWGRAVAAAGAEGWDIGLDVAVVLAVVLLGRRVVGELCRRELAGELLDGGVRESLAADLGGLGGAHWLWALDLRG